MDIGGLSDDREPLGGGHDPEKVTATMKLDKVNPLTIVPGAVLSRKALQEAIRGIPLAFAAIPFFKRSSRIIVVSKLELSCIELDYAVRAAKLNGVDMSEIEVIAGKSFVGCFPKTCPEPEICMIRKAVERLA